MEKQQATDHSVRNLAQFLDDRNTIWPVNFQSINVMICKYFLGDVCKTRSKLGSALQKNCLKITDKGSFKLQAHVKEVRLRSYCLYQCTPLLKCL